MHTAIQLKRRHFCCKDMLLAGFVHHSSLFKIHVPRHVPVFEIHRHLFEFVFTSKAQSIVILLGPSHHVNDIMLAYQPTTCAILSAMDFHSTHAVVISYGKYCVLYGICCRTKVA